MYLEHKRFIWICSAILILFILVYPGMNLFARDTRILETIHVKEAKELFDKYKNDPSFAIIDVRTLEEYKSCHLKNAINIDFYSESFRDELDKLDKSKTYLIYCRSGRRSGRTLQIMKELRFKEVYDMSGGISMWEAIAAPCV